MRIRFPIKNGRRWVLADEEQLNAPFVNARGEVTELTLRSFAEYVGPAVREMADGKLVLADARMKVYDSLEQLSVSPCFVLSGKQQWLGDFDWMNVVMNTNCALIMEARSHEQAMDRLQIELYPAFELIRDAQGRRSRDLAGAWREAGGRMVDGNRLVGAKDDPIWSRISVFGHCHPPFDFDRWDTFEEIDSEQAIHLGVIERNKSIMSVRCRGCVDGD